MMTKSTPVQWKSFAVRIILPTLCTIALFLSAIFLIIIPAIEKNSLDRKREMIRELTNSAWNILAKFEYDEQKGLLTRDQAQKQAVEQIRNLHYGQQMKDYFWINDMHPRMVIHPYRTDLNDKDLTGYTDPNGKRVFVEMVAVVRQQGAGYVEYMWQWKDDEKRIVPKISFVKGFAPWGWVIGTGIYIEDVKAEIALLTRSVITISLFILLIMALLLTFISVQNYKTEKQRTIAEKALQESEEKYRTLVESASEGMLMALGDRYLYANQTISKLLEYNQAEFGQLHIHEIFADTQTDPGFRNVQDLIAGKTVPDRYESKLKTKSGTTKDVILSTSRIFIGGKSGFIAVATDITKRKQAEDALGQSEEKFRTLANNLNVGVFRRTIANTPRFVEVNPAMVKLLGYENKEELLAISVLDLYQNPEEKKKLRSKAKDGVLEREIVKLRKKDGATFSASIWAVMVKDENGTPQYFDGIMEDITDIKAKEAEQEKLLAEMQTAMLFLNRSIETVQSYNITACSPTTSVQDAVNLLNQNNSDVLLIKDEHENSLGVITDYDLRKNMLALDRMLQRPVADIMSSPVISVPAHACLFEAGLLMEQNSISHLFVTNNQGNITGVIHNDDVTAIQKYSPAILLRSLQNAGSPDDIIRQNAVFPYLITTLINSGAKAQYINYLITLNTDTVLNKFIGFAMDELGQPPASFTFLIFGSEGRREQTLKTDQDNAIIFEDVPLEMQASVQEYFVQLGKKVCTWLDQTGYAYCEGENMAQNPPWCQPLSTWKKYFTSWVSTAEAEDLLQTKIFFDFRSAYGEEDFVIQLRRHLNGVIAKNPRFFLLLARNVLQLTPPIGLFGKFVVESVEEHGKAFDIKSSMLPIVDYARIYALQHGIDETNTLERLHQLYQRNLLTSQNYHEMVQAYTYLMQIRLRMQAEAISQAKKNPDNYVSPENLTYIEQRLLKEIFSQTKNFQTKLSYDFTGRTGGV